MSIKVIVELKAAPGRRDELAGVLHEMLAGMGPALNEMGCLGSDFYEVIDDPDALVEIAEWETAAAREAVINDPSTAEVMAPVFELLAAPFKATLVQPV
jgi:quinol monooxygenase YgiN